MSTTVSELVALVNKLSYEDRQRFIQIVRKLNDASDLSPIKRNRSETDKEELFND
jgi:SpoVK/Ycf46/Vps4 family AAA+-type ATPase